MIGKENKFGVMNHKIKESNSSKTIGKWLLVNGGMEI